jgi:SAM-dependent methyltransferase
MTSWDPEKVFDEDYLHFYGPNLTDAVSGAQVDQIWEMAGIEVGTEVLDLACGHGRIANRLAVKGAVVTGLDVTPMFLERAREDAAVRGVRVDYVEGDMRKLPWTDRFDAVVCWFTAFGYFDDDENRAVLREVQRALRPGGRLVLELNHRDNLMMRLLPSIVTEVDGDLMADRHTFDPLTGRMQVERTILRGASRRTETFFTRLFGFTELRDWLLDAGFETVAGYGEDGGRLRAESRRLLVVATT